MLKFYFQVTKDHALFDFVSDLYDSFSGRMARKRKNEIMNPNKDFAEELKPGKNDIQQKRVQINTLIADILEKVQSIVYFY